MIVKRTSPVSLILGLYFGSLFLFCGSPSLGANENPQSINLSGRLQSTTDSDTPILDPSIRVKLQVLDAQQTCILYEEEQLISTQNSKGYFDLVLGSPKVGSPKRTANDPGHALRSIFSNNQLVSLTGKLLTNGTACTYNPMGGDSRFVRMEMTLSKDGSVRTFTPNLEVNTSPSALVAESLQGYGPSQFVFLGTQPDLTQANIETLFSPTNFQRLTGLLAVPNTNYLQTNSNGTSPIASLPTNPTSNLAAGQIWYDSTSKILKYYDGTLVRSVMESGSSGSVTNVSSANSDIAIINNTTTPIITLNSGTSGGAGDANKIAKLNAGGLLPVGMIPGLDTSQFTAGTLSVARGGTGANNFAINSAVATNASGNQVAVPGSTANTMLQWSLTGPAWSSATYPATTTANQLLYSSSNNIITGLATANNAILVTNGSGIPAWAPLSNDSYTQYAQLAGRAGGQSLSGGTAASENLTLDSTTDATKGNIILAPSGGNVGIGTSTPTAPLDILNTQSVATTNAEYGLKVTRYQAVNDSNVKYGILGTSSAYAPGALSRTIGVGGIVTQSNGILGYGSSLSASASVNSGTISNRNGLVIDDTMGAGTLTNQYGVYVNSLTKGSTSNYAIYTDGTTPSYFGGNVGIGTTAPSYKLDVNGSLNATSLYINGSAFSPNNYSSSVAAGGGYAQTITQSAVDAASAARGALVLQNNGTGGANELNLVGKNAAGTTTSYISQDGTASFASQILAPTLFGSASASGNLTLDSTSNATKGNILLAPSGGNVGIGTNSPGFKLHVEGTSGANLNAFMLKNSTSPSAIDQGVNIRMDLGTVPITKLLAGSEDGTGNNAYFAIQTRGSNSTTEKVRVLGNGKVGIGTSSPSTTLDLVGVATTRNSNIGSTATDGLVLTNDTIATAGVGQNSPRLRFHGSGWDTTNTLAKSVDVTMEVLGQSTTDNSSSPMFAIKGSVSGGPYVSALSIDQYGNSTFGGALVTSSANGYVTQFGPFNGDRSSLGTTSTDGLILSNSTAATAGVPVQISPRIRLRSKAWDTGTVSSVNSDWKIESLSSSGNPASSSLQIGHSQDGAAYSTPMVINSSGYVGIGTTAPQKTLEIDANLGGNYTSTGSPAEILYIKNTNGGGSKGAFIKFNPTSTANPFAWMGAVNDGPNANSSTFIFGGRDPSGSTDSERMRITGTGRVGIGTSTPGYSLDVNGTVNATAFSIAGVNFDPGALTSSVAAGGGYTQTITQSAVDAASAARGALVLQNNGTGGTNELNLVGKNATGTITSFISQDGTASFASKILAPTLFGSASASGNLTLDSTTDATKGNVILAPSGGNVGIGTISPSSSLEVNGDIKIVTSAGVLNRFFRAEEVGVAGNKAGIAFGNNAVKGAIYGSSGTTGIKIVGANSPVDIGTTSGTDATDISAFTSRLFISSTGNVGIGTTNPSVKLLINGGADTVNSGNEIIRLQSAVDNTHILQQGIDSASGYSWIRAMQAGVGEKNLSLQPLGGNVGIGTQTPVAPLEVNNNASTGAGIVSTLFINDIGGASILGRKARGTQTAPLAVNSGDILFALQSGAFDGSAIQYPGQIYFVTNGTIAAGSIPTDFVVSTGSSSLGTERMRVTSTGNVGIGTSTPSAKLEVAGEVALQSSSEGASTYVNSSTAYTIPDTSLNIRRITLTGNATLTLPAFAPTATRVYTLTVFLKQDATGTRTVTFAGNGADTVKWDSGVAPTISTTANKITILQLTKPSDETVWYGSMVWKEN